jgi:stress response protein SCP2
MKELIKGANTALAASGKVWIRLSWRTAPGELDFACFALDAQERVLADDWFVFYNQTASPGGAIRLDLQRAEFLINLEALPGAVRKCIFVATLSGGSFRTVDDATFIAVPAAGDSALFRLREPVDGRSLLLAELYRYNDLWKVRAKGDGLKHDLAALAGTFGVDVIDDAHHAATGKADAKTHAAPDRPAASARSTVANPPPRPATAPSPLLEPTARQVVQSANRSVPPPPPPATVQPVQPPAIPWPASAPPVRPTLADTPSGRSPDIVGSTVPASQPGFHERIKPYATPLAILFSGLIGATATVIATLLVTQCAPRQPVQPVVIVQPPTAPSAIERPATNPVPPTANPSPVGEKPTVQTRSSSSP